MSDLRKKAIMLIISSILLVSVLVYVSFAWYTKMTSVAGLTFKTAKWDVSANYQLDSFTVNVYDYNTIGPEKYAAPGVWGFIPIEMTASGANTDVSYTITVDKSTLSKEFQDRLYFYYYTGAGEPPENYQLPAESDLAELKASGSDRTSIIGTVEFDAEDPGLACIYWHWVYDYAEWVEVNDPSQSGVIAIFEQLEDDDPANVSILCTYSNETLAFKTEGLKPADKYYTKSDTIQRVEYDITNWAEEAVKPPLYLDTTSMDPISGSPDLTGATTYYYETLYPPYTGTSAPSAGTQLYVKDGIRYKEAVFHLENQLFKKTHPDGTIEYYALTSDQIKTLKNYRTTTRALPDSPYTSDYTFFEDYYNNYCTARDEFDRFDTRVGLTPSAYINQMNATVLVTGEHVTPEQH